MEYSISDLEAWNEIIEKKVKEFNLDVYEQEFEIISFNEMLGYEAYVGMPTRYPHWSFGKAYEKNKLLYSYNLTGLPYEMVINSNPCLAYLMKDNTLLLQILTMAHVYGHNDFFKNNRLFREGTRAKYSLEMFNIDSKIIRDYINSPSIGYEKVERILDAAHSIRYNINRVIGTKFKSQQEIKEELIDDYENKIENADIFNGEEIVMPDLDKLPLEPYDDIVGFIIEYGKLEEWEKDILRVVKRETEYFLPQIETKIMNEGWASFWHYNILKSLNLSEKLHFEFLKRHNDVVAPVRYGLNPYYLGFRIFEDIEKRYGREKIFEVRYLERDSSFIRKYLTRDLCEELHLFEYSKRTIDYVIEEVSDEQGWKKIRDNLADNCGMGAIPFIRVVEYDKKRNRLLLEHVFDGRELEIVYAKETIKNLQQLWGGSIVIQTKTKDGKSFGIYCNEDKQVSLIDGNTN
ncbi:MAG: SpoVR family protein [Clostridium sp.]|nr:SpoVR family protein [Clostridium sp.]